MEDFEEYTADAAVIGAGHAGIEAALALARTGLNTVILTLNLDGIGFLPCNPSIGGTAKGHLVREIDALGGEMGIIADKTALQMRMLNAGKGAAVQCLRAQTDKAAYHREMKRVLESRPNLRVLQAEAAEILTENGKCAGVKTTYGGIIRCHAVVVCTGVYLNSQTITGDLVQPSGPNGFSRATKLTASLAALGYKIRRFKTGTPARVDGKTVNFAVCEEQKGDEKGYAFSFVTDDPPKNTASCHLTYTNAKTHEIILENLDRSPLYNGLITSTGPRYCPSVETKIVRFKDKERHQVFLEPEGSDTSEIYVGGMSTSMPHDVQRKMYASVAGLEHADVVRYGYAIEYDCIDPTNLKNTLEFKAVPHLYGAGQFNGTSGYEEAAAQGLLAGANAALAVLGKEPMTLPRYTSYLGTLVDDLVTKGVMDPYRMMTSRSEYRLSLRQDNADERLTPIGREYGLVDDTRWAAFTHDMEVKKAELHRLETTKVPLAELRTVAPPEVLETLGESGGTAAELLKRPGVHYELLAKVIGRGQDVSAAMALRIETEIRYAGYIAREQRAIHEVQRHENVVIPDDFDYAPLETVTLEAREKLAKIRPRTLAQAGRIPGVNPSDLAQLSIALMKAGKTAAAE